MSAPPPAERPVPEGEVGAAWRPPPDVLWQVLQYVAAHGHTREVAMVTLAARDLHHDAELLGWIIHAKTHHHGETLVARAVRRGDRARVVELLAACPTPAARRAVLNPPVGHLLSLCQDAETVQYLLAQGARLPVVDGQSGELRSAVTYSFGKPAAVAELLASLDDVVREALVKRRNQSGWSLLSSARDAAMALVLLDAGASGLADGGGHDDFDRHAGEERDGAPGVLAAMLAALDDEARRARVARRDEDGRTLLMGAISGVDVQALLDAGAELDAISNFGGDAFDFSVNLIWNNYVFKAGEESALAALLHALGSDDARRQRVIRLDGDGRSLLMYLSSDGDARALLRAGAQAHVWDVDNDGNDALWHAVHRDDLMGCDLLPVLLAAMTSERSVEAVHTRVNRLDKDLRTLLMHSRTGEDAQALLDAGANLRLRDRKGHDAIWYVNELGSDCVEYQFQKLKVLLLALDDDERQQRMAVDSMFFASLALLGDAKDSLQFLVDQGLNVNSRWADGCDLFLYVATKHGCDAQPLLDVLLHKRGPQEREAVMQRAEIQAALARRTGR